MSTKKIREALGALLAESARANDFAGRERIASDSERALYREALAEVEAIEKAAVVMFGRVHGDAMDMAVDIFRSIADNNEEESK